MNWWQHRKLHRLIKKPQWNPGELRICWLCGKGWQAGPTADYVMTLTSRQIDATLGSEGDEPRNS